MKCINNKTLFKVGLLVTVVFLWKIILSLPSDTLIPNARSKKEKLPAKDPWYEIPIEEDIPLTQSTYKQPLDIRTVSRLVAVVGSNYNDQSLRLHGLKRPYVFLVPHFMTPAVNTMKILPRQDRSSLVRLVDFLVNNDNLDGAFGLPQGGSSIRSMDSTPCQFKIRDRSVLVRNTDRLYKRNQNTERQECNYSDGPVLLKRRIFQSTSWNHELGQLTFLDFLLSLGRKLHMTKISNCVFTNKTYYKDRGSVREDKDFAEYAKFGLKHNILRFIYEDRIEWTQCVAHWSLCKEEPLTIPQSITDISMPICCSHILDTFLKDIVDVLVHFNLTHRVIYGTLLGGVRSKAIIPWTNDVDIGLTEIDYFNDTIYEKMQNFLDNKYWLGYSYIDTYRAHPLFPPEIKANLTYWIRTDQESFFHDRIIEAMDILADQVQDDWRSRCYIDFYPSPDVWLNGSAIVTINGKEYMTLPKIDYELENWYGKKYRVPIVDKQWVGITDLGAV